MPRLTLEQQKDDMEEAELDKQLLEAQKQGKLADAEAQMAQGYEPNSAETQTEEEGQEQEGSDNDPDAEAQTSETGPSEEEEEREDTREEEEEQAADTGHQDTDTRTAGQEDNWQERYKEVQQWATRVNMENKDLLKRMSQLEQNQKSAQSQEQKADEEKRKAERETALQQFREEFPEAAEYTDKLVSQLIEESQRAADEKIKPINDRMAQIDFSLFSNEVLGAHPDAVDLMNSPAFQAHLRNSGEEGHFVQVYDGRNAAQVNQVFQRYKNQQELSRLRAENEKLQGQLGAIKGEGDAAREAAERQRKLDAQNALEDNRSGSRGGSQPRPSGKSRTWTRSQIANMSDADYLKNEKELDQAMKDGRIVDDR
jgi:hypothetical protein